MYLLVIIKHFYQLSNLLITRVFTIGGTEHNILHFKKIEMEDRYIELDVPG